MLNILFFSSLLALAAGSIPLWLNAIVRKRSTGSILQTRETSGSPFGVLDIIVMFFFWFVGQIASAGVAANLLGVSFSGLASTEGTKLASLMFITAAGQLASTLLAMSVLVVRYRDLSIFGWQPRNLIRDLVIGGLAFVLVVPTILIVQWALTQIVAYRQPTLEMLAKNSDVLTIGSAWFGAVLVAPICEEIFFRGVLQAWLQRLGKGRFLSDQVLMGGWDNIGDASKKLDSASDKEQVRPESDEIPATLSKSRVDSAYLDSDSHPYFPPLTTENVPFPKASSGSSAISNSFWPILISAAIFGLVHLGQGPAPIPLFLFGLALGYLYRKTGSIMACIVLHMLLNGFSMFWFTLNVLFKSEEPTSPAEMAQLVEYLCQFVSKI